MVIIFVVTSVVDSGLGSSGFFCGKYLLAKGKFGRVHKNQAVNLLQILIHGVVTLFFEVKLVVKITEIRVRTAFERIPVNSAPIFSKPLVPLKFYTPHTINKNILVGFSKAAMVSKLYHCRFFYTGITRKWRWAGKENKLFFTTATTF